MRRKHRLLGGSWLTSGTTSPLDSNDHEPCLRRRRESLADRWTRLHLVFGDNALLHLSESLTGPATRPIPLNPPRFLQRKREPGEENVLEWDAKPTTDPKEISTVTSIASEAVVPNQIPTQDGRVGPPPNPVDLASIGSEDGLAAPPSQSSLTSRQKFYLFYYFFTAFVISSFLVYFLFWCYRKKRRKEREAIERSGEIPLPRSRAEPSESETSFEQGAGGSLTSSACGDGRTGAPEHFYTSSVWG